MKIKEIYVSISFPYQLSQYQNGKIEIGELISLEEGEDAAQIQSDTAKKITKKCKEEAHNIICGDSKPSENNEENRRRRF